MDVASQKLYWTSRLSFGLVGLVSPTSPTGLVARKVFCEDCEIKSWMGHTHFQKKRQIPDANTMEATDPK